jgi:hypothetical protein
MSTESIPPHKWKLAVSIFLIIIIMGLFVLIFLSLGVADPPRAGELTWQTNSINNWTPLQTNSVSQRYVAPTPLPHAPFTLEITASNNGAYFSGWGLWLRTTGGIQTFLVSREGYMSISSDDNSHWAQFIHIQTITNKIYLHIEGNQAATLRINDEIAWRGTIVPLVEWGLSLHGSAIITWQAIELYTGE